MLETGRDAIKGFFNSKDRSLGHVALGALICVAAVGASAWVASRHVPTPRNPEAKRVYDRLAQPGFKPPARTFVLVWPPLFTLLAIAGLRIWNARGGPARIRALGLWGAVNALNALWPAWGPKRRLQQFLTALTTLGTTAAFVNEARKVDGGAAAMVAPYAGWISFANLLAEELWRRNRPHGVTLH
jgi:tryptophan-rich sensory protein